MNLSITPRTFLNRKYLSPEEREAAAALPVDVRMGAISSMLVRYARFRDAEDSLRRFHKPVSDGPHSTGKVGAMLGASGTGKSYVLEAYASTLGDVEAEGGRYKRVVYVNLVRGAGPIELARALFSGMGFPYPSRASTGNLIQMAANAINEPRSRVELVIIDDAQYLLCSPKRDHTKHGLGIVTAVAKARRCNVLLGGTVDIATVVRMHEHTLTLGDLHRHDLFPYDWRVEAERGQFLLLLHGIDERLPFRQPSDLMDPAIADSLYRASGGSIGRVMNYVQAAAFNAMNAGQDRITRADWCRAALDRQAPDAPSTLFLDLHDEEVLARREQRSPPAPAAAGLGWGGARDRQMDTPADSEPEPSVKLTKGRAEIPKRTLTKGRY